MMRKTYYTTDPRWLGYATFHRLVDFIALYADAFASSGTRLSVRFTPHKEAATP